MVTGEAAREGVSHRGFYLWVKVVDAITKKWLPVESFESHVYLVECWQCATVNAGQLCYRQPILKSKGDKVSNKAGTFVVTIGVSLLCKVTNAKSVAGAPFVARRGLTKLYIVEGLPAGGSAAVTDKLRSDLAEATRCSLHFPLARRRQMMKLLAFHGRLLA